MRVNRWLSVKYTTAEMMLKAIRVLTTLCVDLGLECRRVPIATARFLESLGYSPSQIRRFWDEAENLNHKRVPIFKSSFAEFDIKFFVDQGPLYEVPLRGYIIPVDESDLRLMDRYLFAPRAHRLYMRLIGRAGGYIDINLIRVLSLAEGKAPGITFRLTEAIEDYLRHEEIKDIDIILRIILNEFREILKIIIPAFPKDISTLKNLIPFLRRLVS